MTALKNQAVEGTGILRDGVFLPEAFPLSFYDPKKCPTPDIRVHTKQELPTGYQRPAKYSSAVWNCQRPYLRCLCKGTVPGGCQGDIMWFDQAIWYMLNNLGVFFGDDHPSLASKFGALIVWLTESARIAATLQITFCFTREMMTDYAIKLALDPQAVITDSYPNAGGVRKIERFLKPPSFSVANPTTPSSNKRPRAAINCNASPEVRRINSPQSSHRGSGRGAHSGGRGPYNSRFRSSQSSANGSPQVMAPRQDKQHASNNNAAFTFYDSSNRSQQSNQRFSTPNPPSRQSHGPSHVKNSNSDPQHSRLSGRSGRPPMKGRFLDWDNLPA
jgi:hypothetical protein